MSTALSVTQQFISQKPTHDFPVGGKVARSFVQPRVSPILNTQPPVSITACVKRLKPLDLPEAALQKLWSSGADAARTTDVKKIATQPSIIQYFNPVNNIVCRPGHRLVPLKGPNAAPVPDEYCVAGFKGVGDVRGAVRNAPSNQVAARRTHAVDSKDLHFFGERKNM